ncbi:hypothetical protein GGR57DRAFT_453589 [Xylariaceae sp. FL1272]|nr:hypothetical protein GGR57DRAFT_453589 [Xylariaceae sp. FL1272]
MGEALGEKVSVVTVPDSVIVVSVQVVSIDVGIVGISDENVMTVVVPDWVIVVSLQVVSIETTGTEEDNVSTVVVPDTVSVVSLQVVSSENDEFGTMMDEPPENVVVSETEGESTTIDVTVPEMISDEYVAVGPTDTADVVLPSGKGTDVDDIVTGVYDGTADDSNDEMLAGDTEVAEDITSLLLDAIRDELARMLSVLGRLDDPVSVTRLEGADGVELPETWLDGVIKDETTVPFATGTPVVRVVPVKVVGEIVIIAIDVVTDVLLALLDVTVELSTAVENEEFNTG